MTLHYCRIIVKTIHKIKSDNDNVLYKLFQYSLNQLIFNFKNIYTTTTVTTEVITK